MRLSRKGFTLAELIVAGAIGAGAAALMTATLVRQQRFYTSAAVILDTRAQLRDAADVLSTDLRGAAVATFGLPVMTDSAVEMFATIATSVVCAVPSTQSIALPPVRLASGTTLTSMLVQPDTGDIALVFVASSSAPDSGRWEPLRLSAFSPRSVATTCPESTGFTTGADMTSGSPSFLATLATVPSSAMRAGLPVHFVRRGRYSLYRASDNNWYLGYRRCNVSGSCSAIQPVSGPYTSYSATSSGLSFRYYDSAGAQLSPGSESTSVARIEIVVRGETARAAALNGDLRKAYRDSVVVSVSPRNRSR
jgi:hypothetical protein